MTYATSVRLDEETKALLNEVAKFRDRSPHWIMKKAIEQYLLSESEEIQFLAERSKLAEADRKAGRLVPADQAIAQLRQRIADRSNGNR